MKHWLLAGAFACACSSGVLAADLGPYEPPPSERPLYEPAPHLGAIWDGFYIGANAGYSWGNDSAASLSGPGAGGSYGLLAPEGWNGGGQVGFNRQFGRIVLGVEADIQAADISDSTAGFGPGGYFGTANVDVDWFSTVRGRIGYAAGPALLYATGGVAFADVDYSATAAGPNVAMSSDSIETGYTVGGGIEWKFAPQWSLKTEYLYVDLGDEALTSPGGAYTARTDVDFHTVRAGLNYHF
jgi:outer membrane immunogenic protein